jgi:hypothetical protein
MNNNLTYLVFVVDKSGSMSGIAKDMIGGFNAFIKAQRDAKLGACKVFFYQFDTDYEPVYQDLNLDDVPELTDKTYQPRGGTALYCSLGKTITDIGTRLAALPDSDRPGKVLVVTITDGEDNARLDNAEDRYTLEKVKEMIEHQIKVYNWDFTYIGANQDAWQVGDAMGIGGNTKLNYTATAGGTAAMFDKLSAGTTAYRSCATAKFAYDADNDQKPVTP